MTTGNTGEWKMSQKIKSMPLFFQPQHKASELRVWTERHLPQLPRLCRHQEGELETQWQIQQLLLVAIVCNRTDLLEKERCKRGVAVNTSQISSGVTW